jgi:hypothetical protein
LVLVALIIFFQRGFIDWNISMKHMKHINM